MKYPFIRWWACKQRPFFVAKQLIIFDADTLIDAEMMAMTSKSISAGGLIHQDDCCYVTKVETPELSEWDLM